MSAEQTIATLLESLAPSMNGCFDNVFSVISVAIKQEVALLSTALAAANLTIDKLNAEKQHHMDLNANLCNILKDVSNRSLERANEIDKLTAENKELRKEIASHDHGRKNMAKKEIALDLKVSRLENENKKITEKYMLEKAEHNKLKTEVQTTPFDAFGRRT